MFHNLRNLFNKYGHKRGYCNKLPEKVEDIGKNIASTGSGKVPSRVLKKRKPTVEEEIILTKKYDLKRLAVFTTCVFACKVLYDAYQNHRQKTLYESENCAMNIWNQVGSDTWNEGRRTKTVRQRYGPKLSLSSDLMNVKNPEVKIEEKSQLLDFNTFEYITEEKIFFLRFRFRIWEDIGTVHIRAPVYSENMKGDIHVVAYTRDGSWILKKSWIEDDDMIIELKKRIDIMDFFSNPDPDVLQ
eukprot:TRINITY_DN10900_c0_g1_i1.p1 TRINITY_DN10900_c0_g1~~TRINITY_DN10900_c0_g1_i1.p1  ORF type:complete len:243 (+),score=27.18 TRINITY_DN10900_c0_g1_i1:12-740(+)